ncbi:membrane protein [Streptomyces sp. TS71-3]|nr:membrane protein [Streptomyces sp. TS71-3]
MGPSSSPSAEARSGPSAADGHRPAGTLAPSDAPGAEPRFSAAATRPSDPPHSPGPPQGSAASRPTPPGSAATSERPHPTRLGPHPARLGALEAGLGVAAFSLTFPATAWGLEGFGAWSLVTVRTLLAGLLAGCWLAVRRVAPPERRHWASLAVVGGGVVIGFPVLTTLALRTSSTAHAAVVVGLLPLATAACSALRTGARPSRTFWGAALAGAAAVVAFTVGQSGGALSSADLYLFGALVVCAAGYTEGGRLAREMPGWQVIGWALVALLPLSMAGAFLALGREPVTLTVHSVTGVLWVAAVSQFLGMVVWYRGMAAIGIPKASQLQLAQPLLTLVWSVLLLGERMTVWAPLTALAVLVCIAVTQRSRG